METWNWLLVNLDTILKVTQLIGIPVAILLYIFNKRNERRDKDYGTYDSLDDKYIDYLNLCLQYPMLDVSDIPKDQPPELTPDQRHSELMMFSILLSIMERAYLMYKDRSYNVRQKQWEGWNGYIRDWVTRANFRNALPQLASGFDSRFVAFLHEIVDFEEE